MMPNRPIRVCRVIARLNGGGPAVHLLHLARALDPERFNQVTVGGRVNPDEVDLTPNARLAGLEVVTIPSLGRDLHPAADAVTVARLVAFFRKWRPDIVETHTAKAGTVGRIAALLAGVPARVHVFHGHVFHGYFPPWKTRVFLEIERALAKASTRIIALGETQRRQLLGYGIGTPDTTVSVPLGFNLDGFLSIPLTADTPRGDALRAEVGVADRVRTTAPVIGIVGRLVSIKAHEVFLDAARTILTEIPDARFAIAGEGERRAELERLAASSPLLGRVHFLGWRHNTVDLYAGLDLTILTSDNEGMPVTIIESLASGVPVVATKVGGIPDLIRDGVNGYLVPPRDPTAVARAALTVLNDPARRASMAVAARTSVVPKYEVGTLVTRMDRLYREIVTGLD
jgi:glycosyltransferase involved in cell wall biosynthesis